MTSPLPTDEDALDKLRQEFEYRIRTSVAYGIGRGKHDDMSSQQKADWIQREIANAMGSPAVAGFRRSVASTRSDEVAVAAERAVHRHLSRLSKRDDWAEDDTAVGGQAAFIVRALTEEGLLAPALSAPPTITDEWCVDCRHCRPHQGVTNPPCGKIHDCPECASQREAAAVSDSSSATPIPEEMVERAAQAGFEHIRNLRPEDHGPYRDWAGESEQYREYLRGIQRAALAAALGGEA